MMYEVLEAQLRQTRHPILKSSWYFIKFFLNLASVFPKSWRWDFLRNT